MSNVLKCCNQPVGQKVLKNGNTGVWCGVCGRQGQAKNINDAFLLLAKSTPSIILPENASQLPVYVASHMNEIMALTAPFIKNDKPAFQRMITRNVRYIMNLKGDAWKKVWNNEEGRDSIIAGLEDAFIDGATFPEMASMVPMGNQGVYIPKIEALEFALTTGKNAPFEWIRIAMIYKNDIYKIHTVNGNYTVEVEENLPRTELIAVVPYGYNKKEKVVLGQLYDIGRIIEKAKNHSKSYKYYLNDLALYQKSRSEGTITIINGRETFKKTIFKSGGGSYEKDIYFDELISPWDGPNMPEMARKLAGKSFFGKDMKVRTSQAAMDEIREDEKIVDDFDSLIGDALSKSMDQFPVEDAQTVEPDNQQQDTQDDMDDPPPTEPEIIDDNDPPANELDFK